MSEQQQICPIGKYLAVPLTFAIGLMETKNGEEPRYSLGLQVKVGEQEYLLYKSGFLREDTEKAKPMEWLIRDLASCGWHTTDPVNETAKFPKDQQVHVEVEHEEYEDKKTKKKVKRAVVKSIFSLLGPQMKPMSSSKKDELSRLFKAKARDLGAPASETPLTPAVDDTPRTSDLPETDEPESDEIPF